MTGRPRRGTCIVDGCDQPGNRGGGMCKLHRTRFLASGDPHAGRVIAAGTVAPDGRDWMEHLGEGLSQGLHALSPAVREMCIEQVLTPEMRERRAAILARRRWEREDAA